MAEGYKGLTVKVLCEELMAQVKKGNGDKHILISDDDEGNGYHTLFFTICDSIKEITDCARAGMFHDHNDPKDVVLLG